MSEPRGENDVLITSSSVARTVECPAWLALPHYPEGASPAASRGTWIHLFLETWGSDIPDRSRADTPAFFQSVQSALLSVEGAPDEIVEFCRTIDLKMISWPWWNDGEEFVELTLAGDMGSGECRVVGSGLNRDYSLIKRGEICGTADVLVVRPDHVYVADYKTGRAVAHPSKNWQLISLAIMASGAFDDLPVRASIIYVNEDGSITEVSHEFSADDLMVFRCVLAEAQERAAAAAAKADLFVQDVAPGDWCRYCPAFRGCPAQLSLVDRIVDMDESKARSNAVAMLGSSATEAYEVWQRMRRVVNEVGKVIHAHARENPISLPDGRVFSEAETTRDVLDGAVTVDVLSRMIPPEYALSAAKYSVSKSSVTSAVRGYWGQLPQDKRPTLKSLLDDVSTALSESGAIRPKLSRRFGERRA